MSTATQPAAAAILPLWTVSVHYDGRPLTHTLRATSAIAAIQALADLVALPVEAFTETHAARA